MTIDDIREEIASQAVFWGKSQEYVKKYFHEIPRTVSVDRVEFILNMCKDSVVLDLGCSGPLHPLISRVAKEAWGVDVVAQECKNFIRLDLEKDDLGPLLDKKFDLVICGELLEHLSNPGLVLDKLKQLNSQMIVTLPNAFGQIGLDWAMKGVENVNNEHVAYYSYNTAKELLTRHGWQILKWFWYNGKPITAEGLIFVVR